MRLMGRCESAPGLRPSCFRSPCLRRHGRARAEHRGAATSRHHRITHAKRRVCRLQVLIRDAAARGRASIARTFATDAADGVAALACGKVGMRGKRRTRSRSRHGRPCAWGSDADAGRKAATQNAPGDNPRAFAGLGDRDADLRDGRSALAEAAVGTVVVEPVTTGPMRARTCDAGGLRERHRCAVEVKVGHRKRAGLK